VNREPNFDGGDLGGGDLGGGGLGGGSASDAFDLIVAGWRAEGNVPEWPANGRLPVEAAEIEPLDAPPTTPQPVVPPPAVQPQAVAPEDEHFVPPEPPPLPRIGPPALIGAVLLAVGLILVLTPGWFGLSDIYGLPLGLIALAAGLGWLVLRLWPDSLSAPDRDDGDDGAIL
jgi:hypothetical protein